MSNTDPVPNVPEKSDSSFDSEIDLETLALQQGVAPITNPDLLLGSFWPEDDTEDFLQTLHAWRHDDGKRESHLWQ